LTPLSLRWRATNAYRAEEAEREEKLQKKLQRSEAAARKANTRMWIGLSILTIGVLSPFFIKKKQKGVGHGAEPRAGVAKVALEDEKGH
jgi:hypothetical protein